MSTAWTTGIGAGAVSALQSAGALFMGAVGGSTVVATAAVAAPLAAGAGAIYAYNYFTGGGSKAEATSNGDEPLVSNEVVPPPSDIASLYQSTDPDAQDKHTDCFECSEDEDD